MKQISYLNKTMRFLICFLCSIPAFLSAQQNFTLKSAIDSALKNNLDIQIASNNLEISKLNNSYGMAGGMPVVSIGGTDNQTFSDIYQKQSSGLIIQKNNVAGNNFALGLNTGVLLFNGFKVYATKNRLESIQKQSELMLNQQIQNSIASVMIKYYDIIRQKAYLKVLQKSLVLSQQKYDIVNTRRNIGMANDADFLQVQIDLNQIKQNVELQNVVVEQTEIELLQLINAKIYKKIDVTDSINVDNSIVYDSILSGLKRNQLIQALEEQVKINSLNLKEISSLYYPSLRFNAGYNISLLSSEAGSVLYNKSIGPYVGLALQVPIFNGNITRTQRNIAEYTLENTSLQKDAIENNLMLGATKAWEAYSSNIQQVESQKTTLGIAEQMIILMLTKFQLGQATIVDMKTAQSTYENVCFQYTNLLYSAKVAEIELMRLSYSLKY